MRRVLKNKRLRRFFRGAVALLFVFALLTPGTLSTAAAVSQSDIDALKNDASGLSSKKKAIQEKLDALSEDKSQAVAKKELLDEQIEVLMSQISNVEAQIADYESLISQTKAELADAQAQEQAQYDLFCKRVRAMEERGTISYWSVLFKASSFTDLLSRLDFINEIMDSDQAVISQLQALQDQITQKQMDLELQKSDSEDAKADLVSKKSELDTQREAANQLVKQIESNENEYSDALDDIAAEEDAVQDRITELSRQLAAQQSAAGQTSNAALGGYIWPVSSHYITSTFGGRSSPGGIGSTNHKGIDIGKVGYSTTIHAAKAGTVIVSQRSSSYGNYVVVSHGSGNTTLYAHMSSRSVSVGQYVNQGDALGVTGSTGHSTGPHLHFEISENGVRINPLTYLTNYTLAS
jgi:murein DD-endopeptidase MepM/ murein hydrolase activator NlpD